MCNSRERCLGLYIEYENSLHVIDFFDRYFFYSIKCQQDKLYYEFIVLFWKDNLWSHNFNEYKTALTYKIQQWALGN